MTRFITRKTRSGRKVRHPVRGKRGRRGVDVDLQPVKKGLLIGFVGPPTAAGPPIGGVLAATLPDRLSAGGGRSGRKSRKSRKKHKKSKKHKRHKR